MSGGAFGGARGYTPRPPEKGVFPLDHFGECGRAKEAYMECLAQLGGDAAACREAAKRYLECRMERNLMAQQDLGELGFGEETAAGTEGVGAQRPGRKEAAGFVAGLAKFEAAGGQQKSGAAPTK